MTANWTNRTAAQGATQGRMLARGRLLLALMHQNARAMPMHHGDTPLMTCDYLRDLVEPLHLGVSAV